MVGLAPYALLQMERVVDDGLVIQRKGHLTGFTRLSGALYEFSDKVFIKVQIVPVHQRLDAFIDNTAPYPLERLERQFAPGTIGQQHIPLVNASREPGEWQSYAVVFTAPRFDGEGMLLSPAYMTAFHNGVLIQDRAELQGPTVWIGEPKYEAHAERLPLLLQDHGNPVSYRNIWVREISRVR